MNECETNNDYNFGDDMLQIKRVNTIITALWCLVYVYVKSHERKYLISSKLFQSDGRLV